MVGQTSVALSFKGCAAARFVYVDVGNVRGPGLRHSLGAQDETTPRWIVVGAAPAGRAEKPGSTGWRIPGTGKDSGPNCATVTPIGSGRLSQTNASGPADEPHRKHHDAAQ